MSKHLWNLFWYYVKLRHCISFNVLHVLKYEPWDEFSVSDLKETHINNRNETWKGVIETKPNKIQLYMIKGRHLIGSWMLFFFFFFLVELILLNDSFLRTVSKTRLLSGVSCWTVHLFFRKPVSIKGISLFFQHSISY